MQSTASTTATYCFTLDGKEYKSLQQILTGAELRSIAGIVHNIRIFVGDHEKREGDHQIMANTTIDLADPGLKRFYTLAEPSLDIF